MTVYLTVKTPWRIHDGFAKEVVNDKFPLISKQGLPFASHCHSLDVLVTQLGIYTLRGRRHTMARQTLL